jgi:hypothetical protein
MNLEHCTRPSTVDDLEVEHVSGAVVETSVLENHIDLSSGSIDERDQYRVLLTRDVRILRDDFELDRGRLLVLGW